MRSGFVLAAIALTAIASANASMGYALEQYDGRAWLAYVVLTVVFEAWAIGRWAGSSWPAAVGISILANLVTAGCCADLCGVGLHSTFVGSRMNPNPLLNMVVMFTVFGLLSGLIEGVVWRAFRRKVGDPIYLRSVLAHLVSVPAGIAIMLVPAHPYPFLEGYTVYARRFYMMRLVGPLEAKIDETKQIPDYQDTERFFREIGPGDAPPEPDAWTMNYRPDFGRFATGQSRGEPLWEWNSKATGLKITSDKMPDEIWLIRIRPGEQHSWGGSSFGLIWSNGGGVNYAHDPASLGYKPGDFSSP